MGPYGGECINNAIRFYCGISKLEECSLGVKGTKRKRENGQEHGEEEGCGRLKESTHLASDTESGMRMENVIYVSIERKIGVEVVKTRRGGVKERK